MSIEEQAVNNPEAFAQAVHTEAFWDTLLEAQDQQLDPFRGVSYAELDEDKRTELVTVAFQQLNQMKLILRAMALEQPPEVPPKRTRKPREQIVTS